MAAKAPVLKPLDLDALTVVEDHGFLTQIGKEKNLPAYLTKGLPSMY